MTKLRRLQQTLPTRGAALLTHSVSRRYLTGFPSSDGVLLLAREDALLLADSRYLEAARSCVTACPVEEYTDFAGQVRAFCRAHRIRQLFLETSRSTLDEARRCAKQLPGVELRRNDNRIDQALRRQRERKRPEEIAAIRRAQAIAERALEEVRPCIVPGRTERAIALELDYAMLRGGAEALAFETIAAAGENGAKPHAVPGERVLRDGDMLTLDFGAVVDGYHSDMTRTLWIGTPAAQERAIYAIVRQAQTAALAAIGPGVPCKDVDAAARQVIAAAGYGDFFRHGTGHGVGLEIHESPTLSSKSAAVLAPGMVVTVEPGIYIPGQCGVRIEDMVFINENGYENLTGTEK